MQTTYKNHAYFTEQTGLNFKCHAATHISNTGGIEIMLTKDNEGVYFRILYGQDPDTAEIHEADLMYIDSDQDPEQTEPYFLHGETTWYLNKFMRS